MSVPKGQYLLIIGAHMPLRERALVAALRQFPGPIATLWPNPRMRSSKFIDYLITGDPFDPAAALTAVREFEAQTGLRPAAMVPFIDGGLVPGWAIADHYSLPYLSHAAVVNSGINKDLMKDCLLAAGVPTPRYVRISGHDDLPAAIAQVGLPCVVKPSAFGGSLGVRVVATLAEAVEAYDYAADIINRHAATFSVTNTGIQVEEFCALPGEVSVEVLNYGDKRMVLAMVDKSHGPQPFFAEMGHRVPSIHSERADITDMALRACEAIGLDRGLAHVELRHGEGGSPVVIEVGARTAGGGVLDQVGRVLGIEPYELHVRSYLSSDLDDFEWPTVQPRGVSAIAFLKAPKGRITRIDAPERIDPAVVNLEVLAAVGAVSETAANYLNREGYVECYWPQGESSLTRHMEIAEDLAAQMFHVADD